MDLTKKILIVDDSAFMRQLLKDILTGAGFHNIREAENGQVALDQFQANKPDLVFLDIIMPGMGGREVLEKIGHQTTVLMISAVGQDKIIEETKQLGAAGFVVKPFDGPALLQTINHLLPGPGGGAP